MVRLVAAGAGSALVPDLALVALPTGVRVVDMDKPISPTVQLAHRTASADRPAVAAVRDALLAIVGDLAPAGTSSSARAK